MLKKAIILASALALLLASTQLALAQQDANRPRCKQHIRT